MRRMVFKVRYLSLVLFALLAGAWPMAAQAATNPVLGSAAGFAVLAGTAASCTTSAITGKVGVNFTPPTTAGCNAQYAPDAYKAFRKAFTNGLGPCGPTTLGSTLPDPVTNLGPGTYCTGAALTFTNQTLNLTGTNGPWIFEIPAALKATDLTVVMADGGNPCNVFWWVGAAATLTVDTTTNTPFLGTILGGVAITATGSAGNRSALTLTGRLWATGALTMTNATIVGCNASGKPGTQCKQGEGSGEDEDATDQASNRTQDSQSEGGQRHEDCDTAKSDKDDSDQDHSDKDHSDRGDGKGRHR
jgi:hypothetical protein